MVHLGAPEFPCQKLTGKKIHLTGKEYFSLSNLFFPVRRNFSLSIIFFPVKFWIFFPVNFSYSSKIRTINSWWVTHPHVEFVTRVTHQWLINHVSKNLKMKFFDQVLSGRSVGVKLDDHESNWTLQKIKTGRSKGIKLDGLSKSQKPDGQKGWKWTV